MNFSVTGEPAPSQLDQKRKLLMQSLLSGGPGQQRLLGAHQGFARGYTANDSPNAAVPNLTFNPFLAQLQRGASGLSQPTQSVRQQVNDLSGGQQPTVPFGSPGAQAPQPGGAPIPDNGPTGGAQPQDQGAPPMQQQLLSQLMDGQNMPGSGAFLNLFGDGPPPPPLQSQLGWLKPMAGRIINT